MRSEIRVATTKRPPSPASDIVPSHRGLVPAMNITTKAVVPIRAVVPKSTSPSTSTAGRLTIASGRTNPKSSLRLGGSYRANQAARKKTTASFASSDG